MLASTLLGGALADRIPQRHILLAGGAARRSAWPRSPRSPSRARSPCGIWRSSRSSAAWRWASTTRRTRRWCPRSCPRTNCSPRTGSRASSGRRCRTRPARGRGLPRGRAVPRCRAGRHRAVRARRRGVPRRAADDTGPPRPARGRRGRRPGCWPTSARASVYMVRTPWLLATLLFASLMLLASSARSRCSCRSRSRRPAAGPPSTGTCWPRSGRRGRRIARRRLAPAAPALPHRDEPAVGAGLHPAGRVRLPADLWLMIAAGAVMGATFQAGMVIWGTLLQRRVPPALLGRVSSLDFFVSLSFMPLSMALAGTVSEVIGLTRPSSSQVWCRPDGRRGDRRGPAAGRRARPPARRPGGTGPTWPRRGWTASEPPGGPAAAAWMDGRRRDLPGAGGRTVAELSRPDVEPPTGPAPDDLVIEDITVGDGPEATPGAWSARTTSASPTTAASSSTPPGTAATRWSSGWASAWSSRAGTRASPA